jgi:hypothetical protein
MCITCRGKHSAMVNPTTSAEALTSVTIRRTSALLSPRGSAPSPSTISSLSMVSTSKWIATRVQPVAASQPSTGSLDRRRSPGLNERMP